MAYWRWPGSKPWVQTTVGMTQTADWEEGSAAGLLKFDDGTIWCWNSEMAHPAYDYWGYWPVINELAPGSKAWEQITPDYWNDMDTVNNLPIYGASGLLIDGEQLLHDHWYVAHDGGDKSFWVSAGSVWNVDADLVCFIVSKENRSWDMKTIYIDSSSSWSQWIESLPFLYGGYLWFFTHSRTLEGSTYHFVTLLHRMDVESPYSEIIAKTWDYMQPYTVGLYPDRSQFDINPVTGRMYWFDSEFPDVDGDAGVGVDDEGYAYWMIAANQYQREDYDPPVPAAGAAGLWRMKLPDGEWELLYYWQQPKNWIRGQSWSYNLPGGGSNDRWHGPLPIGIGFVPNWWGAKLGIRDGWLYFLNNTYPFAMLSFGWTGGHTWCRIRLSDLANGPVEHDPEDPIFEVLSMTTGGEDSFYNWDDTEYWGGRYKSHGGYGWRDGLNSIHAFVENLWYFDDDGSIVYLHHEYPNWYAQPNDYYPPYIMSRLSPPQNLPITFNLVFEGSELKGYGPVREVPAKTKIGTIELSGE